MSDNVKEIENLRGMSIIYRELSTVYEFMANLIENEHRYTEESFLITLEGLNEAIICLNEKAKMYS